MHALMHVAQAATPFTTLVLDLLHEHFPHVPATDWRASTLTVVPDPPLFVQTRLSNGGRLYVAIVPATDAALEVAHSWINW
jgi:hypothetical protein